MKNEKNSYLDDFVNLLFPGDSKEVTEIKKSYNTLKDSINAFITGFTEVLGEEKAEEELKKCKEDKCNCDKDSCKCVTCDCDYSLFSKEVDKSKQPPLSMADKIKDFYKQNEEKNQNEYLFNEVYNYVIKNLAPKEKGGLLEMCGDVLKMPILDRAIVASYNSLDSKYKSGLVHKLIVDTGFSGISFQTINKTDLYMLFRF